MWISGITSDMETWFLIAGFASIAAFQAFVGFALMRDRARRDRARANLRVDELDADIAAISQRLTKAQKLYAAGMSNEARQEAKTLKQEAMEHLGKQDYPPNASGRPSVVLPFGRK